jgi:hypothetical protein
MIKCHFSQISDLLAGIASLSASQQLSQPPASDILALSGQQESLKQLKAGPQAQLAERRQALEAEGKELIRGAGPGVDTGKMVGGANSLVGEKAVDPRGGSIFPFRQLLCFFPAFSSFPQSHQQRLLSPSIRLHYVNRSRIFCGDQWMESQHSRLSILNRFFKRRRKAKMPFCRLWSAILTKLGRKGAYNPNEMDVEGGEGGVVFGQVNKIFLAQKHSNYNFTGNRFGIHQRSLAITFRGGGEAGEGTGRGHPVAGQHSPGTAVAAQLAGPDRGK